MLSMMGLSHEEHATGVIFGFLREIQKLAEEFEGSKQFAFAWDSRKSYRRDIYPDYKKRTQIEDPEMEDILRSGKPQFDEIRLNVLPKLGFKNNFIQTGLEADDIIAYIARKNVERFEQIYIASSDEDLFQILYDNISIYNPREKKIYTQNDFINEKGITPDQWSWIKAVAGCNSDNIKGIAGVGEKTAIKFLKKELKTGSKKYNDILEFNPNFNLSLVELPHKRTFPIPLIEDELDFSIFEGLCLDYGFNSFLKKDVYKKWEAILCP